jgi:hypothetical protein
MVKTMVGGVSQSYGTCTLKTSISVSDRLYVTGGTFIMAMDVDVLDDSTSLIYDSTYIYYYRY